MKRRASFSTLGLATLVINVLSLGALLVVLFVGGPSGPVVFLTIGVAGMVLAKIGLAYCRRPPADSVVET